MRHELTENYLKAEGVHFSFQSKVPWTQVTKTPEISRQIRLETGTNQETVLQFAMEMEKGVDFPAIVVVGKAPNFTLVNGLHRMDAAELAHRKTTDVYILGINDPLIVESIRRCINNINGQGSPLEDRIQHGLHMYHRGMTLQMAADKAQVNYPMLRSRSQAEHVRKTLIDADLDPTLVAVLSPTVLVDLNKIHRPALRKSVAALIATFAKPTLHVVSHLERNELVSNVAAAQSDEDANTIIERVGTDWAQRSATTQGGKVRAPRRFFHLLPALLSKVNRMVESYDIGDIAQYSTQDRVALATSCANTAEELRSLAKSFKSRKNGKNGKNGGE